jgi:hypothetical protein
MLSADSDQVLEGLPCLFVGSAPRRNTVNDVLGKVLVLAVARRISVVLALRINLKPRVHAFWKHFSGVGGRKARRT